MSNRGVPTTGFRMTNKRKDAMAKAAALGIEFDTSIFANRITHQMGVDELVEFAKNQLNTTQLYSGATDTPIYHAPQHHHSDETTDEINARIKKRFDALRDITIATAVGVNRALIVSGSPGVGKSFEIEKYTSECTKNYTVIKGYATPGSLYRILYEHRHDDSVLIFDDCDSIFSNEDALNLLKSACDSSDVRIIGWGTSARMVDSEGEEIPESFDYEGSIIFITNTDFQAAIDKDNKMSPHFSALVSRSMYLDLGLRSYAERLGRVRYVIDTSDMLSDVISGAQVEELMEYMHESKAKLREISLRTAKKLATLIAVRPQGWRELADLVCCK